MNLHVKICDQFGPNSHCMWFDSHLERYRMWLIVNAFLCGHTLLSGEEHLKFIVAYLMEVATSWPSIGVFLGIPYKYIEVCKLEDTLEESISKMVETWLRRKHDTAAFGEPTYRRLAEAVASRSGGGNLRLAESIARNNPLCYTGEDRVRKEDRLSIKCENVFYLSVVADVQSPQPSGTAQQAISSEFSPYEYLAVVSCIHGGP